MIVKINNSKFLDVSVETLLDESKKYLGQPYVYGGDGTLKECSSSNCTIHKKGIKYKGYDCSGYVFSVLSKWNYNKFGRSTSQMQSQNSYGSWIYSTKDLLPGDLIYFNGHVGIVSKVNNESVMMYHSSKCGKTISETDIKYRKDFTKGLRILKCNLSSNLQKENNNSMKLVILDAGHNEYVSGKCNGNFKEWDFNNKMQNKIKTRLEYHGIKVYLTNPNPEKKDEIGLTKRTTLANNYWKNSGKPKSIFISLHGNAYSNPSVRGTETFHATNASSTSKTFAKTLNDEVYATMKSLDSNAKNRGVKSEDFTVIYKASMPA